MMTSTWRLRLGMRAATIAAAALAGLTCATAAVAAPAPPPGRGYELVSPADTLDVPVFGPVVGGADLASFPDGRVLYASSALLPLSGDQDAGASTSYVAQRSETGWRNTGVLPPDSSHATVYFPADATDDLSTIVFAGRPGPGSTYFPPSGGPTRFQGDSALVRRSADGTTRTIFAVSDAAAHQSTGFVGMARDGGDVLFATDAPPPGSGGTAGVSQVYRATRAGAISVVGVDDGGAPLSDCGVSASGLGYSGSGYASAPSGPNGVSADGSVVFLGTGGFGANGPCSGALYAQTPGGPVEVSAPATGVSPSPSPSHPDFVGATDDGRTAYFFSADPLTADDGNADPDLYRATLDPVAGTRTTLRCVSCAGDPASDARVAGPGALLSADGSHVFFVAVGTIGGAGTDGASNLYVSDGAAVRLVSDQASMLPDSASELYSGGLGVERAQTTPDGRHLLFVAAQDAAGVPVAGTRQLYLATVGDDGPVPTPVCVTCADGHATGSLPGGLIGATNGSAFSSARGGRQVSGIARSISDDGATVAFAAKDVGSPAPANGGINVHVWERGRLSLVNAGDEKGPAGFGGLSADGRDLYFFSSAKLTPDAIQSTYGLYDARVGGGFAPPAAPPAPCAGDACQGPTATPSSPGTPASALTGAEAGGPPAATVPRPTLSVRRVGVSASRITLAVRTPGAGALRLSGRGLVTLDRRVAGATTATLQLRLTTTARRALAAHGVARFAVRVRFAPRSGREIVRMTHVTIQRKARSNRKGR